MTTALTYLWIALGGALGSAARFWLSGAIGQRVGEIFPWGTIIVNITGSLIIGFFATVTAAEGRWLLLFYQVPAKPPYLRVKLSRRLGKVGALAVKPTVYVLPKSDGSLRASCRFATS